MREELTASPGLEEVRTGESGGILANEGYQGAGTSFVVTPYSGRNKPSPRTKRTEHTPSLTAVIAGIDINGVGSGGKN